MTVIPTIRILASSRGLGVCRGCKAEIEWATVAETGRRMCFDRVKVLDQEIDDQDRAIQTVDRSLNHWATCPNANRFRKGNR